MSRYAIVHQTLVVVSCMVSKTLIAQLVWLKTLLPCEPYLCYVLVEFYLKLLFSHSDSNV